MKETVIKGLKQINKTSNKGLYKLKDSVDISDYNVLVQSKNEDKTYMADSSLFSSDENGIPLSGTVSGSPVTGNIEIGDIYDINIKQNYVNDTIEDYTNIILFKQNEGITIQSTNNLNSSQGYLNISENGISIFGNGSTFSLDGTAAQVNVPNGTRGITSLIDYTPYITNLDFTQKKYVGYRGTAILASGTVTVSDANIKTGAKIYVSCDTPSGTQGFLSASTADIVDATSFVINSTSVLDNSTVNWWIVPNV